MTQDNVPLLKWSTTTDIKHTFFFLLLLLCESYSCLNTS